jgi:hypothetical protein
MAAPAVAAAPALGGAGALPPAADMPATNGMMADNAPAFVPGKAVEEFRVYARAADGWNATVYNHYRAMRTNQTLAYVNGQLAKYGEATFGVRPVTAEGAKLLAAAGVASGVAGAPDGSKGLALSIRDMFRLLEKYVDASDPDTELPNLVHMVQTAERARAAGEPVRQLSLPALPALPAGVLGRSDSRGGGSGGAGRGGQGRAREGEYRWVGADANALQCGRARPSPAGLLPSS